MWHLLSWYAYKSRRHVRSFWAAEIIAAGHAIDEGILLAGTLSDIYNLTFKRIVEPESKDIFRSLSTQLNSVDKIIRADVNDTIHQFERISVSRIT